MELRSTRRRGYGFAVAAIMTLAACGGGSGTTAASDATTASATSALPDVTTSSPTGTVSDMTAPPDATASTPTSTSSGTTTVPRAAASVPTTVVLPPAELRARECDVQVDVASAVECWWVPVPIDYSDPGAGSYDLAVSVMRAAGEQTVPPIVMLTGGPGNAGLDHGFGNTVFVEDRDFIVYNQRGTGTSAPDTQCPEIESVYIELLMRAAPFDEELAARDGAIAACFHRLSDSGVDLDSFDTSTSARDLDRIRAALGYDRWNLWGWSYGTRLALEVVRQFPDTVEAVVLDSVYPNTAGAAGRSTRAAEVAIDGLAQACEDDQSCGSSHGDLRQSTGEVAEIYNETPVPVSREIDGQVVEFEVTGNDLVAGLVEALLDPGILVELIPTFIDQLRAGDTTIASALIDRGPPGPTAFAEGMGLATECADNASLASDADWRAARGDLGDYATIRYFNLGSGCEAFRVDPLPPSFTEPVMSDVPALVLTNAIDPRTPPDDTRDTAALLENSTLVEYPGVGHGVIYQSDCTVTITRRFLAEPDAAVDTSCLDNEPGPFD